MMKAQYGNFGQVIRGAPECVHQDLFCKMTNPGTPCSIGGPGLQI
jgi:hypothetical protein